MEGPHWPAWLHPHPLSLGRTNGPHLGNQSDPFENGTIVFDQEVGERMSGYLTTEEMQTAFAPVCHFLPEEEQKL
jgi:hypothetical protein